MVIYNIAFFRDLFIHYALPLMLTIIAFVSLLEWIKKHKKDHSQLESSLKRNAHGIIFGKKGQSVVFSPTNQEGHIAVFGGTGLGKTSALLIPTLRSWNGTSLTIDISGDICKNVDIPNKLIYEPGNSKSVPYNIFEPIDNLANEDDQNELLEQLTFLLMPDSEKMADTARFFNTEGRKILTSAFIAFYHLGLDFISICELIVESSWKDLFNMIDATENLKAINYITSFIGTSEQNTAGCKQAADTVLKLFASNERVKRTIRRPHQQELSFTPETLENNNVFIVVEDSKLKLYAPLLHIITAQCLEYFSNRPNDNKSTILFCLDEFASLGKLEITDALRKLRKKHIRIMMLTQSLADIDLIYGKDERMAMMNNYKFKIVLGTNDTDTQEYFAKLIGYKNVKKKSTSSNSTQTTYSERDAKEWVVEPAHLAWLGNTLILLHSDGHMRLHKNFYYKS